VRSPAGALIATLRLLAEHVEGAWWREAGGAHLFVSGVRVATLNVVVATGEDVSAPAVEELLDAVAATRLPYSLNARPGALPGLAATAMAFTVGDAVGIFNVGTLRPHRRRGYGAAITARAVADGLAAGGRWAWLESSDDGLRVYERLGFATVETHAVWTAQNTFASSQSAAK
jgi:hypothetical protein